MLLRKKKYNNLFKLTLTTVRSSDNFAIPESAPISGKHCIHITMTLLPECNDDVGDGPAYDERDGAVQGDFRDVRDARRQPNVGQGNLQRNNMIKVG